MLDVLLLVDEVLVDEHLDARAEIDGRGARARGDRNDECEAS